MPRTRKIASRHTPFRSACAVCLVVLSCLVMSERTFAIEGGRPYRSPGDMSVDERMSMMKMVGEYNSCVYREGMANVDKFADIRQSADLALAACQNTSNELRAMIDGYGFEPGFGEHFVHHAQSRAARTLIPELAIRKSGN